MASSVSTDRIQGRPSTVTIWLPVVGSLAGICTIVTVYWLTFHHGHLPGIDTSTISIDGIDDNADDATTTVALITPPISLLGCQEPERTVYRVGFSLTAALLGGVIHNWKRWFFPSVVASDHPRSAWMMRVGAYLAVLGLVGQGIVTLERDLWAKLVIQQLQSQQTGRETIPMELSPESIRHQEFAAVFFFGSCLALLYDRLLYLGVFFFFLFLYINSNYNTAAAVVHRLTSKGNNTDMYITPYYRK